MTLDVRRWSTALMTVTVALATLAAVPPAAAVTPSVPWTWGGNGFGELGDGTTAARRTPAPVADLAGVVDLHGGREHVVALRSDGTVWVWGSNVQGQLGLGTSTNVAVPTQVAALSGIVAVETGHNHSLALTAGGTVWTWGLNADGQLGDGTTTLRRSPVRVAGLADAVAIAAGRNMSYAIRADGSVLGWGRNAEGQLGDGTTTTRRLTPVRVGSLTQVVGIAGGRDHGLALREDGTVWAWGANAYGQVGDGTLVNRTGPVQVAAGMTEVIAGAHHSYALRSDGQVAAWGRNYRANLGDGTTTNRRTPVLVRGVDDAVSLGSGRDHGLAVLADGTMRAWGYNASGQLGDGTTTNRTSAVTVAGVSGAVKAGGGGQAYSVALVDTGTSPNRAPTAAATFSCTLLECHFDGSASADPDGTVTAYSWDFGDGAVDTGATVTHTYAATGTWPVTLTVTDDDGATAQVTRQVSVSDEPPPAGVVFRAAASSGGNLVSASVGIPAAVQDGDRLLLVVTANRRATLTVPPGWSQLGVVTDGTEVRSWLLTRAAVPGSAGTSVPVALDALSKVSLTLMAYGAAGGVSAFASAAEAGTSTTHTAPASTAAVAGSTVLRYWADKTSTPHGWTLPAGLTWRAATTGSGGGMLTSVAADSGGWPAGVVPAQSATAGASASKAVAWTVVVPPG